MSGQAFTDQYGTELTVIGESALPGCARVGVSERCGAHIPAEDFPRLITALYAAAGKPEPVILDCLTREQCHQQSVDGIRTYLAEGRLVGLDGSNDDMSPATALILAGRLASLAGLAENEPDPAEADNLTGAIAEALKGPVIDASADLNTSRIAARTALRWMREREAKP